MRKFNAKELNTIETRLLVDPVSPHALVDTIEILRKKYQTENEPKMINGKSPLWKYTSQINKHFGHNLIMPCGMSVSDEIYIDQDEVWFFVDNYIALRENGKPDNSFLSKAKRWLKNYEKSREDPLKQLFTKALGKKEYEEFCDENYKEFFSEMFAYDWKNVNMEFFGFDKGLYSTFEETILKKAAAENKLVAKVRKATFEHGTNTLIECIDY